MNPLYSLIEKKRILLTAHRGVCAGNIPCNTAESYEAAIIQGADIIELDVSVSKDGKLYCFHPGMERAHLGSPVFIKDMYSDEVEKLRYLNFDNVPTEYGVSTFYDVMSRLKGRCFINVDKFWTAMKDITEVIRSLGMEEQVIVKSSFNEKELFSLEQTAPELMYMAIVRDKDTVSDLLLASNLNFIGVEALFDTDGKEIASEVYINAMHEKGLAVWCNSIVYDYRDVIAAKHNDDISASGDPDSGWGWIAKRGFDIMQTDWLMPADAYLKSKGYRV